MAASFLFVHDVNSFSIALVVHGFLVGCMNTSTPSISQRLLPRDKFAEIGSAGGVLSSLIGIFVAPTIGLILDHENHDYRYTFLMGFIVTIMNLAALIILYVKFMALGGPKNYIAPNTESVIS